MKKFTYPFAKILRVKEQELDAMQLELMQLRSEREQLRCQLDAQNKAWLMFDRESRESMTLGISGEQFKGIVFQKNSILQSIKDLEKQVLKMDLQIDVKLQSVLKKRIEVEGFIKLKEKQKEVFIEQYRKAEQLHLEELIVLQGTQQN